MNINEDHEKLKTKQKKKNIFLDCLEDTIPNFYRKSPNNHKKDYKQNLMNNYSFKNNKSVMEPNFENCDLIENI